MQVTNGDIWQARAPLQELLAERWPVKTAYWLARLATQFDKHFPVIEQVRIGLIRQYGEELEGGNRIEVSPNSPKHAEFKKDLGELFDVEVELWGEKIVLPDVEGIKLAPAVLMALEPFVEVV